jgi:GntR family transcriptional regulator, transcriptional repressor for pyruvate dehydrogenase complex
VTSAAEPSVPRVKVSELLADRLRGEIAGGAYRPGQFLPTEAALMAQYAVGRPSTREALRILESDGLIRVARGVNGGAEVLTPDPQSLARRAGFYLQLKGADLADIRAARDFVDPGAIGLAADRRDPDDIARLRACVDRVRRCRDGVEFGEIAADFVESLLVASGNQTLSLFALVIDRLLRQEFHRFTDDVEGWTRGEKAEFFASEWTHVVDLIEVGDADGAVRAWAEHRRAVDPTRLGDDDAFVVYPRV